MTAKATVLEEWRHLPGGAQRPGGVYVSTKRVMPVYADLCALAVAASQLVPVALSGVATKRVSEALEAVLAFQCDGVAVRPDDDRPASVLDTDVRGKRLKAAWRRLLQLDDALLPPWSGLLATAGGGSSS